ncbi:MAG: hypothetical protein F6J98_09325 [Moorea sp. SIO4G2]|nr:hypothetical protein [Moorena sp. SIO4G2]
MARLRPLADATRTSIARLRDSRQSRRYANVHRVQPSNLQPSTFNLQLSTFNLQPSTL